MNRPTASAGFTLIEVIVVIVIVSLIGSLILLRHPMQSAGLNFDATQRALTSALRLARSRAIAQDRVVAVVTGPTGFSVDGGGPWLLPAGETISSAQLLFLPDGGASGGPVVLAASGRRTAVAVNWLTGRVSLRELNVE